MRHILALAFVALFLGALPGCSSGPLSNAYYQEVDDFNDHVNDTIHFDHVYYWYCQECGCRDHMPFGNCY